MSLTSLSKKSEFRNLFKQGRRFFKEHLVAVATSLPSDKVDAFLLKVAYTLPKKKFSKAITRNKIKRKLRAALYTLIKEINIELPTTILMNIIPSVKIIHITFQQLYSETNSLLEEILAYYGKSNKDSK